MNDQDERKDLGDVGGKGVGDGLLQVIEDNSTFFDSENDRGEVIVLKNHIGGLFGDIRAGDSHRNANVSLLQSRRVVHTITSDGNDRTSTLATLRINRWDAERMQRGWRGRGKKGEERGEERREDLDNDKLLLRRSTSKDNLVIAKNLIKLIIRHILKDVTRNNDRLGLALCIFRKLFYLDTFSVRNVLDGVVFDDADLASDGFGGDRVITSHHNDLNVRRLASRNGTRDGLARRIDERDETNESETISGEIGGFGVEFESFLLK